MVRRATILLVSVLQIFNMFCSRKIYTEPVAVNAEKNSDRKETVHEKSYQPIKKVSSAALTPGINVDRNSDRENLAGLPKNPEELFFNIKAEEVIKTARRYLGVPHCMSGTSSVCMDCSGLLVAVFGKFGIQLPHNSEAQSSFGRRIEEKSDLRKGDLVFFIRSYNTRKYITHSGIYIGNGRFIHTSSSSGVTITSLNDPWWREKFIFGTRILD
jgi:cell wall-associated NlpC family hydrolase